MKNTVLVTLFFILVNVILTNAQVTQLGVDSVGRATIDTPSTTGSKKSLDQQQLIKIKIADLPSSITSKLKTESYHDWIIKDAYKNMVLKQYSVRLKKGNDIVFYTFDYSGERIKD